MCKGPGAEKVFGVFEEQHKEKCERKEDEVVVNVRWDKNINMSCYGMITR